MVSLSLSKRVQHGRLAQQGWPWCFVAHCLHESAGQRTICELKSLMQTSQINLGTMFWCAIFFICISTDLPPEYSSIFSEMLRQHNCNTMDHNNNSFSLSVSDHYNLHCIYLSIGNWKKYCHIKYKDLSFIFSYNMSNKLWLIIIMANK